MTDTTTALRIVCGHDSRSVVGCLHCEAADLIDQLRAAAAPAGKPAADFKKSLGESVTPIGYARKQDLLIYSPAWMAYATKPALENGYEPIALYTQDQVDALAAPAGEPLRGALAGLLEIEEARIKSGEFKPNAEGLKRIEAARAVLAAPAGEPTGGGR